MSDESAFLAAIRAAPADDLPRLVYADWLDETGEPDNAARAEFIRVQCAIARGEDKGRRFTSRRRERHLWEHDDDLWFPLPPSENGWNLCLREHKSSVHSDHQPVAIVRRGFVDTVRCTLAGWCGGECGRCGGTGLIGEERRACPGCPGLLGPVPGYGGTGRVAGIGPAVVAAHPVTAVVLSDREPHHVADLWWFHCRGDGYFHWPDSCRLPPELGEAAGGRRTRELALDALSAALILWAKGELVVGQIREAYLPNPHFAQL